MTVLLALALLGGAAWAQQAVPEQAGPAQASTAAAVATPEPEAEKPPAPRSRVHVHADAADWDPVSVRLLPGCASRTSFERRVRKLKKGGYRGEPSAAKAAARIYPAGEDRWLVVSVHPAALRSQRTHLEARFLIQEGYLEEVRVAAVSAVGRAADEDEDSFSLRAKGVDFIEVSPGGAEVELSAIDPGPGGRVFNAGRVRHAFFGDKDLGFVNFSWSLSRVSGVKPPKRPAPRPPRGRGLSFPKD